MPVPFSTHFSYSYLGNTGRVASMTNPDGQSTAYTYQDSTTTGEPRLSEIKNLNASSGVISKFDYSYDVSGQITSWTQQTDSNDPQNYALQYDNDGRLVAANVTDTTTSALLHQYAYAYDGAGNRTAEQIDGNVTSSTYNNLNQLTGQSLGGNMIFSGSVSKYSTVTVGGNPATLDTSNNFSGTATVSTGTNNVSVVAQDVDGNVSTNNYQVVVPSGSGSSYTYDLNGNLTSDGSRTFSWDAKNELVKITYADTSYTVFTYNGVGARVAIQEYDNTTSHNLTSTKQFVGNEERDASNTVTNRYFSQGEQRIVSGTASNYFYTRDHLGSIREMVASDGSTIEARYNYDPYGRATKVSGSLDCDFQYAGYYYHAASGLYLSATRAYNPNLGRFISRDPSGESSGLNLYGYCGNNPICDIDPIGLANYTVTDAQINSQLQVIYDKMNGQNMSSTSVYNMWGSQYPNFLAIETDTAYHTQPDRQNTYTYSGSQYPELQGLTLTGHELNYIGVGAAMAGRLTPTQANALVILWDLSNGEGYPSPNTFAATQAGYNAYKRAGGSPGSGTSANPDIDAFPNNSNNSGNSDNSGCVDDSDSD